jgi:hypothetical protein
MPTDLSRQALQRHLKWARGLAIFWSVLALAVFGAAFALSNLFEIADAERVPALVMLGTLIILNAIWHAVGMLLVRFENMNASRPASDASQ